MRLPIEVFETVIDQASDNTKSLRNLSLTCATLLPRSRYHLFSSVHIHTIEQMESSRDFLDAHPWILPLLRKVTLSFAVAPKDRSKRNARLLDVAPVHLLTRLPNLREWNMGPVYPALDSTSASDRENRAVISFHRSALSLYSRYSTPIQSLNLHRIRFYCLSDFTKLVSAFTSIQTLTCSHIAFQRKEAPNQMSHVGGTGWLSRAGLSHLSTLAIGPYVVNCASEYTLACYGGSLSSRIIVIENDFEPLEKPLSRLARLSSLTLVIILVDREFQRFSKNIRSLTRVLKSIEKTHLANVLVECRGQWNRGSIASLGSMLSGPDAPSLDDCKLFEEALLTFPNPRILVKDDNDFRGWRVTGRTEFWSPAIELAFPTLNKRGLLDLTRSKTDCPDAASGHEGYVMSLVPSHDSSWVVTASVDDTIIIWGTSSGAVLHEWSARQHGVLNLALSPDSRRLVSAGYHKTIVVWAIDNDIKNVATLEGHTDAIADCAWSPEGALIASASRDRTVRVWDGHTFQQHDICLNWHERHLHRLQFSPDGHYLAWISDFEECCIWRPLTGQEPKKLPLYPDRSGIRTWALSFDPESRRVATCHGRFLDSHDCMPDTCVVRVWDIATGATLVILGGSSSSEVLNSSFSPDGRLLLSASRDGSLRIWDVESGEQTALFKDSDDSLWIERAFFSPDSKYVAIVLGPWGRRGHVHIWRLGDGSCVAIFREHKAETVERVAFTPCGQFLVSGDTSGSVHIRRLSDFIV